ncbi:MAG TPA: sigma-70 family RNA polymerase sigma factor [Bryobacteraceae bacterium]|jgi:RNA polymerase sigma-70 factor (ECF subfamily)|nr:sigma-70 family RNA polymerase sigma factor [Bryobacteraceae bacterium]
MCAKFELANLIASYADTCEWQAKQSKAAEYNLVRRLQTSKETAYRQFIEQYQSRVYRLAYGILGDRADADEIAQRVFVKAYFSIKNFDARASLYVWLYRTTVNECYRFLRKKPGSAPTTDRVAHQRNLLNQLLERIREKDRYLLLLTELEDYSAAKLSGMTGLSEKTISRKLFRTRQRLAKGFLCEVQP